MDIIHKQHFEIRDFWRFVVPSGSKILKVDVQDGKPTFWYSFNHRYLYGGEKEERMLTIVGTGHVYNSDVVNYLGTIQRPPFVWHIFELKHVTSIST